MSFDPFDPFEPLLTELDLTEEFTDVYEWAEHLLMCLKNSCEREGLAVPDAQLTARDLSHRLNAYGWADDILMYLEHHFEPEIMARQVARTREQRRTVLTQVVRIEIRTLSLVFPQGSMPLHLEACKAYLIDRMMLDDICAKTNTAMQNQFDLFTVVCQEKMQMLEGNPSLTRDQCDKAKGILDRAMKASLSEHFKDVDALKAAFNVKLGTIDASLNVRLERTERGVIWTLIRMVADLKNQRATEFVRNAYRKHADALVDVLENCILSGGGRR